MSADFNVAMNKAKKEAAKNDKAEANRKMNLSEEEQKKELESGKKKEVSAVDKEKEAEDRKKLQELTKPKFDLPAVTG